MLTADTTVTWSLRRDSNARPSPYRGDALSAGATKARAWRPGLEPGSSRVKAERVCRFLYRPSRAPGRNRTGCLPGTSWPLCQVSYKGIVSQARFERALPTSSSWCLLPLGYEDMEPLPRLERGASDLRGRRSGQMSYRGTTWGTWARTRNLLIQSQARCRLRHSPSVRTERFESSDDQVGRLGSRHARTVRHLGLEPRTSGLRVRHSAIELAAPGASPGN